MNNCSQREFLEQNKSKFGIIRDIPETEYINISVKRVRAVATKDIRMSVPLPGISSILDGCKGMVAYPGEIDTGYVGFRVTNAKEELVYCDTDRPGVKVNISGQIVVRSKPKGDDCPPVYIAFPVRIAADTLYNFHRAADGSLITDLKKELSYVDGSCMTIQLNCSICKRNSSGCCEYVARIRGVVTDRLWKRENIWVEGTSPYPDDAVTFCDRFDNDCPGRGDCEGTADCDEETL